MNTTTLQKCVDELKKESPDIRYILGMLETYIELNTQTMSTFATASSTVIRPPVVEEKVDETDPEQIRLAKLYESGQVGKIA
jgi:hypothetical protein